MSRMYIATPPVLVSESTRRKDFRFGNLQSPNSFAFFSSLPQSSPRPLLSLPPYHLPQNQLTTPQRFPPKIPNPYPVCSRVSSTSVAHDSPQFQPPPQHQPHPHHQPPPQPSLLKFTIPFVTACFDDDCATTSQSSCANPQPRPHRSAEFSGRPGMSPSVSLTMFVCGVSTDVTLLHLERMFSHHGATQISWYESKRHSEIEDAQRSLGNCLHVTFHDANRLKRLVSECIYDDKDEYFYFISTENCFSSKPSGLLNGKWIQLVPWERQHDVWCGDLQCSDNNKALIRNVCGNLSARKLAEFLSKRFGQVGYCILHLSNANSPNFYPSGTGNVAFVDAADRDRAIRAGRICVRNSTHASTLYIIPHDGKSK